MILILSQAFSEFSTELVIDWLCYKQAPYFLLTGEELLATTALQFSLDAAGYSLKIKDGQKEITSDDIRIVWFRRKVSDVPFLFYDQLDCSEKSKQALLPYLKQEFSLFYSTLSLSLNKTPWLNHPETANQNKLKVLIHAHECGLKIPVTFVSNQFNKALNNENCFITKPLTDGVRIPAGDNQYYGMLSSLVETRATDPDQTYIFPSLLQEYIEKEFELRVFYLDGKCSSIAIFSQLDNQTSVDFRNYNEQRPNRYVPYKLPVSVEKKINRLMRRLKLASGSIDLIKTKDGRYVFLEVNPVGQFDWVSLYGNYALEKDISEYLINKNLYASKENKKTETVGQRKQQQVSVEFPLST